MKKIPYFYHIMTHFLDSVATDLYARYGEKLSELQLVFPNRRSRLFFARSLSKFIDKPLWQPRYSSIEEVVNQATGRKASDSLSLLFELYAVYCSVYHSSESFDRFYFWGEVMLRDFDLIDKYRIDANQLFRNLKAQKKLEGDLSFLTEEQIMYIRKFWSSFSAEKSMLQDRFIAVWEVLPEIYTTFRQRLNEKDMAYEGMLYRDLDAGNIPGTTFIFIGFNALNESEKIFFRQLREQGKAQFYWDYDNYYLNNPQQEAGTFLRQNMKEFPSPLFDPAFSAFSEEKDITVVAAPSDMMQAKLTPQLLEAMKATPDSNTAVVLADESLLIPTLHALPATAAEINVTMGYPLKQTLLYTLLELQLQLYCKTKQNNGSIRFYHRDVLSLLYHPYIKALSPQFAQKEAKEIVRKNKVYVSPDDFSDDSLLSQIFTPVSHYGALIAKLLYLLEAITDVTLPGESELLTHTCAWHCIRLLRKLEKSVKESSITLSIPVFVNMLHKLFRNESIPFTGEPLTGIQVLGLLETRNLDFEHVVLLSCNEGILPANAHTPSFIPYNLRRGFGLPVSGQHEAIYAYYFYRLLQRAKKISLVYNTKTDETHTGEASRYLLQLQMETGHKIRKSDISFTVSHHKPPDITIQKDEKVMQELMRYCREDTTYRLSPSAINTYLECSLRFYYRYVAHLKPLDEISEDTDNKLLGNVLHYTMDTLYKAFEQKTLHTNDIKALASDIPHLTETVNLALADAYYHTCNLPEEASNDGKIILLRDVIKKYILQILQYDATQAPFTVEGTEKTFKHDIDITVNEIPLTVKLGGILDRLDSRENHLYIIDYKTGVTKKEFKNVAALFDADLASQNPAVLQILLYATLLKQQYPVREITPKLYFMREIYQPNVNFLLVEKDTKQVVNEISAYVAPFTAALADTLVQIFNPLIPFYQATNSEACTYCNYKKICHRNIIEM